MHTKKSFYVKDKNKFELYAKICKALNVNYSQRLNEMYEGDLLLMIEVIEALKVGEKRDVKEN